MAGQGRKPRPRALKLVDGRSEGRDSGGRKVGTPPAFLRTPPEKPDYLDDVAGQLWDRIVDQLPQLGILKDLDGPALEMLCETYARWRTAVDMRHRVGSLMKQSYGTTVGPWVRIETQASKEFRSWCSEFGLTPSAEMRLAGEGGSAAGDPESNPFAAGT